MIKSIYTTLLVLFVAATSALAQSGVGAVKGKVTDADSKQTVIGASVRLYLNGLQKSVTVTDVNGSYKFSALTPGRYDIKVKYVGYGEKQIDGVLIEADATAVKNISLSLGNELKAVEIEAYVVPLIKRDQTSTGGTVTRAEIEAAPIRDIGGLAATSAGVQQSDDGGAINVKGSRDNATDIFIDGMRVRGGANLPNAAIEQVSVVTGGVSPQYGDVTGGVISVTTRGASNEFTGGGEILTSQKLDAFGYNLAALNFSGPLLRKTEINGTKRAILGYFISGEYETQLESDPSAIGIWQVKDEKLKSLQKSPLIASGFGFVPSASFLTQDDLYISKVRPFANDSRLSAAGKIDFQPGENATFTVGGNYDLTSGRNLIRAYSLLNAANSSEFKNNTWRAYARFKQRFGIDTVGILRNAYYTIQADYTKTTTYSGDPNLGKDAFGYGYIGNFDQVLGRGYTLLADTLRRSDSSIVIDRNGNPVVGGSSIGSFILAQNGSTTESINYMGAAAGYDPLYLAHATSFYDLLGRTTLTNFQELAQLGGLVNGLRPQSVYGIWQNSGRQSGGYSYTDNDQFRLTGQASADIKGHTLLVGFEFDQRTDRGYQFLPFTTNGGLWEQARGLTNNHIAGLDLDNPTLNYDPVSGNITTVDYERKYAGDLQTGFDKKLRAALGYATTGLDVINIDKLTPSQLKLAYFSPDNLLNDGNAFVSYYGYDYLGNKLKTNPSSLGFFTDETNRGIAAFAPVYVAGYIEDKFDFDDIVCRVGLRVDRFDANQPMLKDPYLFEPALTLGEAKNINPTLMSGANTPSNIGEDYVVYVDNVANPTQVTGYRNGNRWYNVEGGELRTGLGISQASNGQISPYLSPGRTQVAGIDASPDAFMDYIPQINFMPRIAFSFPISEDALFFAHYDILTARPPSALRFDPTDYAYITTNSTNILNNSGLRPERTIDYQLGFNQKLNEKSALKIAAFYREMRDMIQIQTIAYAYPIDYRTYRNLDFGTVKGLTLSYDLRRTGNVRLNANYTLQFASGTGSDANTSQNVVNNQGIDAIRVLLPLSFDARHRLVTSLDYSYGSGKSYNGPRLGSVEILKNTSFNLLLSASSGTPYTGKLGVTADGDPAEGVTGGVSRVKGTINGSRLPWNTRANIRIDKDFSVKKTNFTVYVQLLNALNNKNVLNVYGFTGNPVDDGYINSPLGEQALNGALNSKAFETLYSAAVQNPDNYSLPRRIRLGLRFNF